MLIYVQMINALIMGLIAAITDFKDKKIYNKSIVIFSLISVLFYILMYKEIDVIYIKAFLINIVLSIIISFSFFYLKIWSAGDAKLFIAIILMIPYELYELGEKNYFGGLYILIITFCIAFIYVFFETVFLFLFDSDKKETLKLPKMDKNEIINNVFLYFIGFFFSLLLNNIIEIFFYDFYINNSELCFILNFLLIFFLYRILNNRKKIIVTVCFLFITNTIFYIINGINNFYIDYKMLIVVFLILLYRNFAEKYNYKTIKIEDLKDRMILSIESVLNFYSSKVKGLPKFTDESTDCRLNKEEVESIKRWSKTSKGNDEIVIVRHMPFAPFMFIGELVFFVIKVLI